MRPILRSAGVVAAIAAAALSAGCGSSDDGTAKGTATAAGSSSGNVTAFIAKTKKLVADASQPQAVRPPTSGPKPAAGKSVVAIPCSMAAEGCARSARTFIQGAKLLGWKTTLIDPQGDPAKIANAIRQAITLKPDGIFLGSIDAKTQLAPIKAARAAGIKIASFGGIDEGKLFDVNISSTLADYEKQGYLAAAAGYLGADEKLKMLMITDSEFAAVGARVAGAKRFVSECKAAGGDCSVEAEQGIQVADLATRVPQQTADLARQHPDFTVLWVGYDAAATFAVQGMKQAGMANKGFAVGHDANSANIADIAKGGYERYTVGMPQEWIGYAAADELNRVFQGQPLAGEDPPTKLMDKANAPASGKWTGDFDALPLFKKIWGV